MAFDVADLLQELFGGVVPMTLTTATATLAELTDALDDPLLVNTFANWIYRPDSHDHMGWEAPDLPEWQRWWARCDFEDLPELPNGISIPLGRND